MMLVVDKTRTALFLFSIVQLLAILFYYFPNKEQLQSEDCALSPYLQSNYPIPESILPYVVIFHQVTPSFIWMQISVLFGFFYDFHLGCEMYSVIVFGHVIKNFAKSFLFSPRVFWFCEEGHALYCGSGKF